MPRGKKVFLGLNQTGVLVFIILAVVTLGCGCWIPLTIDSMKGETD